MLQNEILQLFHIIFISFFPPLYTLWYGVVLEPFPAAYGRRKGTPPNESLAHRRAPMCTLYLAQGYLGTRTPPRFCPYLGLNREPAASQSYPNVTKSSFLFEKKKFIYSADS